MINSLSVLLLISSVAEEVVVPSSENQSDEDFAVLDAARSLKTIEQGHVAVDLSEWIPGFSTVEIVLYNGRVEPGPLIRDGKINPGVAQSWTRKLSKKQVEKLISAITGKHQPKPDPLCFVPHHGFIFRDASLKIVGSLEVCTLCESHRYYPYKPTGLSLYWDVVALKALIEELGMPTFRSIADGDAFFADKDKLNKGPKVPLKDNGRGQ